MQKSSFFTLLDQKYSSLTPKQSRIADYLRKNYRNAVFMPIAKLAAETGVSEASFIRFARSLGYDGFAELQHDIQNHISDAMADTVERFQSMSDSAGTDEICRSHIRNNVRSLGTLDRLIAADKLKDFSEHLLRAGKIYIVGFESTAAFAEYTGYYLSRGGLHGDVITEKSGNLFSRIQQADSRTLVIAFMVARYPSTAVKFCRDCTAGGASLGLISDTAETPVSDIADYCFNVSNKRTEGVNMESQVGMLSLIQMILLTAIFSGNGDIEKNLENLEEYNQKYSVFDH